METPAQPPIHGTLLKNARRGTACAASNLHKNGVDGQQFAPVNRRTARLAQRLIYTITALSGGSLRSWTGVRRGTTCAAPNLRKNGVVWPQFVPVNPTCVAARLAQSPICAKRRCRAAVCTSEPARVAAQQARRVFCAKRRCQAAICAREPAHSAAGAACNLRENGAVVRRFASVDRRASR